MTPINPQLKGLYMTLTNHNFNSVIDRIKNSLDAKESLNVKAFMSSNKDKRFLIGKNQESVNATKFFDFAGVIDDDVNSEPAWNNLPVFTMKSIPKDSWILNCSTSISPVDVVEKLNDYGIVNIINCCEFWRYNSSIKFELPWFINQQRLDCENNLNDWSDLYDALEDAESKTTLLDTIAFRLTGDPLYMKNYSVRLNEQYFESFLNLDNEIFIDCGGFDGDSTEIFCEKYPNYKKVFFFEPSQLNLQAAKKRLENYSKINYLAFGLSNEEGRLNFDPTAGSASSIQSASEHSIEVCKLDNKIKEKITFLKMDIEGWEMHALEGCANTIKTYSPKLAIAVYHSASDFLKVFKKIKEYQPKYKVRLRHYTQGWSETVMYFSLT